MYSMSDQRRRRWSRIKPTFDPCLAHAGVLPSEYYIVCRGSIAFGIRYLATGRPYYMYYG